MNWFFIDQKPREITKKIGKLSTGEEDWEDVYRSIKKTTCQTCRPYYIHQVIDLFITLISVIKITVRSAILIITVISPYLNYFSKVY